MNSQPRTAVTAMNQPPPSSRAKSPRSTSQGEMSLAKPTSAIGKRTEGLGLLPVISTAPSRPETANVLGIPPKKGLNLEEALLQKETEQKQKKEKERLEKLEQERRERIKGKRNLERSTSLINFLELDSVESTNELSAAKIIINADGVIEYWSDNSENLLGWNSEEISGKNIIEVIPETRDFIPHLQRCVQCEDSSDETPGAKKKIFWTMSLESLFMDKNKPCIAHHKDFGQMSCELHIRPVRLENGLRFAVNIREFPATTEALLNVASESSQKKSEGAACGSVFNMDLLASKLNEELQKGAIS